jgi:hypothetical protein
MSILLAALAYGSVISDDRPPDRYAHVPGKATVVLWVSMDEVQRLCGDKAHPIPAGMVINGCVRLDGSIVLPDPCDEPVWDIYAHRACHELGHFNGWPSDHPGE